MQREVKSGSLLFVLAVAGCLALVPASITMAGEGSESHEGHAHGGEAKNEEVSKKDVAKKIEHYIKGDTKTKGGYFLVYDEEGEKPLALTLKGVHKDMVMMAGEGEYFACADFVDPSGKVYDVDILVKHAGDHGLEVSEVSIHKEGDEPRYEWHKTEHGMEKQPVGHGGSEAKKAEEKPSRRERRGSGSRSY